MKQQLTKWMRGLGLVVAMVTPSVLCAQEPVEVASATAMARVTKRVAPDFPPVAKQLNLSGPQDVSVVVNAAGDVEDAKVIKGNAVFSSASLAAVKQWKFTPMVKDGQATKFTTIVTFSYQR